MMNPVRLSSSACAVVDAKHVISAAAHRRVNKREKPVTDMKCSLLQVWSANYVLLGRAGEVN